MSNTVRRQVISDNLIDTQVFCRLLNYTLSQVKDVDNMSQIEITKVLLPKRLSNVTIAKIINTLLPEASATKGSVASIVKNIRNNNNLLDELLQDIGDV
ncbi:MAG: hypothetical protein NC218_08505 [Acetobacter sp.]|nr:hypothetical protein [Acetobacter sp.]